MKIRPLVLAAALATSPFVVLAQKASAPAKPAASAPASAAKKALVAKVLQLQTPGIEAMARQLAEQPAMQMLQQVGPALQRVPADKREALAKDIQADARKYAEDATPIVREQALKLAPSTIGALLEERFSEEELKQVIALLESPVNRKFQSMGGDMQRVLGEKLVAETRASVDPKVKALEQSIVKRIDTAAAAAAASSPKP